MPDHDTQPLPASGDAGTDRKLATRWIAEIEAYERAAATWTERASKITRIYLDEHRNEHSKRRFALLWSNIETLKPAVYARPPVAVVSRRYKDADPAGRKASEVLERAINTSFDLGGFDEVMRAVRDDRLLAARGQAWVRYEADIEGEGTGNERLTAERVVIDHVHWSDFGHTLDRTWREVRAVWRKVYLTRAQVEKRFGETKAEKLSYSLRPDFGSKDDPERQQSEEPQACIYEIWDRVGRKVIWLAKEEKIVLESGRPPLDFRRGFPCPEPCYGTKATKSLIPIPDYRYYQDQAEEIDDLTEKIAVLVSWLRLRGLIPGGVSSEGADAVKQALSLEGDQVFVTLESWAGFAEKGGARGLIEWMPLDLVTAALREALHARTQLIQDVYQITGISDILRGETNPYETFGAQELKMQSGTRRLRTAQQEIARFARDIAELVGEVIAEQLQPETIAAMTGIDLATSPPPELLIELQALQQRLQAPAPGVGQAPDLGRGQAPPVTAVTSPQPDPAAQQALQQVQAQLQQFSLNGQVVALLRDDRMRGFRVEIETDSTVQPDETAEKQSRVEFLTTVGGFIQQAQPVLAAAPDLAPVIAEMMMFMVRGFRAGRSMEDVIEQAMASLQQRLSAPRPDPVQAKTEADANARADEHRQALEQAEQHHRQRMQEAAQQFQQTLALEREKAAAEMEFERRRREGARQLELDKVALPKELETKAVEQWQQHMTHAMGEAMAQMSAQLAAAIGQMGQRIERFAADVAAPAEIVRDQSGRAVGIRRVRDAAGRPTGIQ